MYFYESHLGPIYFVKEPFSSDFLCCSACGGWDVLIGEFNSAKEFVEYFADEIDFDGCGRFFVEYICKMLNECFGENSISIDDIILLCEKNCTEERKELAKELGC